LRHFSGAVWYICQNLSEEKQPLLVIGITNSLNLSMQLQIMILKFIFKKKPEGVKTSVFQFG
jgi:hypothetical protein